MRALEVYFLSGRTLTAHFADTRAPLAGWTVVGLAVRPPWPEAIAAASRGASTPSSRAGSWTRCARCSRGGVPRHGAAVHGLRLPRVLEHLRGERDEASTRELIVRENRHYARRQLIWFRKEPNLVWIQRAGERDESLHEAERLIDARLARASHALPRQRRHPTHGPDV